MECVKTIEIASINLNLNTMNTAFTKEDFNALDFDIKCIVMEQMQADKFFQDKTIIELDLDKILEN